MDIVANRLLLWSVRSLPIDIVDIIFVFSGVTQCRGKLTARFNIPLSEISDVQYHNGEFFIYSGGKIWIYDSLFTLNGSFHVGIHLKEFIIVKSHVVVAFSNRNMIRIFDIRGRRHLTWPLFKKPICGIVAYDCNCVMVILQCDSFAQVFGLNGTYHYSIGNTFTSNITFYRLLTRLSYFHVLINENTEFKLYADGRMVRSYPNLFWNKEHKFLFFTLKYAVSPLGEVCFLMPRMTDGCVFDLIFLKLVEVLPAHNVKQTGLKFLRSIRLDADAKLILFKPDGTLCVLTRGGELLCYQ